MKAETNASTAVLLPSDFSILTLDGGAPETNRTSDLPIRRGYSIH
jgi:hypothetical protein